MKMTIQQAKAQLAEVGCTLAKREGEFRVRLKNAPAGMGYFTSDLADAVATGRDMSRRDVKAREGLDACVQRAIASFVPNPALVARSQLHDRA